MSPAEENGLIDEECSQGKRRKSWIASTITPHGIGSPSADEPSAWALRTQLPTCLGPPQAITDIYIQQVSSNIHPSNVTNRCQLYRKKTIGDMAQYVTTGLFRLHRLLWEAEMDRSYTFACSLILFLKCFSLVPSCVPPVHPVHREQQSMPGELRVLASGKRRVTPLW